MSTVSASDPLSLQRIHRWVSMSLSRKFMMGTAVGLVLVSLVFLALFMTMYRQQLEQDKTSSAAHLNRVLQTSLEAAMLRRDLDALRLLVAQLGALDGVDGVMIVNPKGEVRFSNHHDRVGTPLHGACPACTAEAPDHAAEPVMLATTSRTGRAVLRSVQPVRNKASCVECHGPIAENPVNGILLVDYDTRSLEGQARRTTLALMGAGAIVVFVTLIGGWWFMRRHVLHPVQQLTHTSSSLANGDLDARTRLRGTDELAQLGQSFDEMATALQASLRETHEQRAFLQALVDAIPDGIRVIDSGYKIVLANQAYAHQLGIEPGAAAGTSCFSSTHQRQEPCAPTLVTCPVHEIGHHGNPVKSVHRHIHVDGTPHDYEVYAAPMHIDVDEEPRTLVVESIRDLVDDIKFSHEQKLSELGRLAAGVAHEIHNPLASIRLTLDSSTRRNAAGEINQDKVRECLALVSRETDRCLGVTERLLKLSMFAGDQAQPVQVNAAITETVSLLIEEARHADIEITQSLDPSEPRILANESDLRMVVLNLVQNAFHAMPEGGVARVSTRRMDGSVELEFTDSGVGIAAGDLPHIFEPFFSRRADHHKGTGLGLAISRAIVERYGGRMGVQSVPGKGTVFVLRFDDPDAEHSAHP